MQPAIAEASVSLAFAPRQPSVARIVRWVTDFCELSVEDEYVVARMQLAAYELVENLVKYASESRVRLDVQIERQLQTSVLRIKTSNSASPERLAEAVRILSGLQQASDPIAFYDQLVLEAAPKQGVSGLGLARIRAEGQLEIDFKVSGNHLSIIVQAELHDEEAS